jgi:hypothetical protein
MEPFLDIEDFNEKGEMKTPVKLVLALLFMSRHFVFLLLAGLSQFMSARSGFDAGAFGLPSAWLLLTDIPVFLLLMLIARKDKLSDGGRLKRLFTQLPQLLALLGLAQLLLIIGLEHKALLRPEPLRLVDLSLLLACVYYLLRNRKAKWFFREYGHNSAA